MICAGLVGVIAIPSFAREGSPADLKSKVAPVLGKYCTGCHGDKEPMAGLSLTKLIAGKGGVNQKALWDKVYRRLNAGTMPPSGSPKPSAKEKAAVLTWIKEGDSANCDVKDPGRVTLRRLNKVEYDNTIRDLFGLTGTFSADFPSDDVGYGFDNIGDVLSMSTLHLEKYLDAALNVVEQAIPSGATVNKTFNGSEMDGRGNPTNQGDYLLYMASSADMRFTAPEAGRYSLKVVAWGQQAGPDICRGAIIVNGKTIQPIAVPGVQDKPTEIEIPVDLFKGTNAISIAFTNDYYKPDDPNPRNRDRNMLVSSVTIRGPLSGGQSELPKWLANPGETKAQVRTMLSRFVKRAYRRPPTDEELNKLVGLVNNATKRGKTFGFGLRLAVASVLTSPHFLFLVEADPAGIKGTTRRLSGYEIASRLSYFLWSSTPDDALLAAADRGELDTNAGIQTQTARMLRSPKVSALSDSFATQWLQVRRLETHRPDAKQFPEFTNALKADLIDEVKEFFNYIVVNNRPALDFITADYSFLNDRLGNFYGIGPVGSQTLRKTSWPDDKRGGLLGMSAILSSTSNPTRTSPVKRGKWILETLLGAAPPPPPPGVGNLKEDEVRTAASLRERLAFHRRKPECSVCHNQMDAMGLSLENFDAVGKWRDTDGGQRIDSKGVLPDGKSFEGVRGLRGIILDRKDEFIHCLTEKLLTFALGRGLNPTDACVLDAAVKKGPTVTLSDLITVIVTSEPFTSRSIK